ncbi:MAG: AtpZ/AtpI family protein [Dehalococcoidia bacterium]
MHSKKMQLVLKLIGIGWYVGLCICVGAILGYWGDQRLDTSPLFTLIGVLVGVLCAVMGMIMMLVAILKEN